MKKIVEQLHQTLLLLILSIVMHLASAQGKYPVRTWSSNEYKGGNAVMAVIQDSTGIAYLACHKGLVIFDGARFQLIKMPKNSMPLWFANGENGRVYVSAEDELGYITKEASGHTYHSLTHLIPDYAQGFGSVWEVAQTNYGTYFRTTHYLFRYYQNNIEVLPRENYEGTSFDVIFTIDSTLYLRKYNLGIGKMIGKTFELLPNGDFFKNIKVNAILPFDNRTMVVTRQNGIFVMDEAGVTEFENEIQEQLKIDKAYHATIFKNKIAIATLTNGTYLLNNEGKLLEHFDKKYKLSEAATYVYFDNMGGLWTTTYNGLWRADLNDHIKVYDGISNEKTLILDMKRRDETFLLATATGFYYTHAENFEQAIKAPEINNPVYDIFDLDGNVFLYANNGTYLFDDENRAKLVHVKAGPVAKLSSNGYYLIGGQKGVDLFEYSDLSGFKHIQYLGGPDNVRSIVEWLPNKICASSTSGGLWFYDLENRVESVFPNFGNCSVLMVDSMLLVHSNEKVYEFKDNEFILSSLVYDHIDSTNHRVNTITKGPMNNVLLLYNDDEGKVSGKLLNKNNAGSYLSYQLPDMGLFTWDFSEVYLEKNGVIWFSGDEKLIKIIVSKNIEARASPKILFSKITAGGNLLNPIGRPKINFTNNRLSFFYNSPYFNSYGDNEYRYRLKGFDKTWSNWENAHSKEYSYLPAGNYIFEVQARNPVHTESNVESFGFSILPPWYQTWWAWVLLGLLGAMLVTILVVTRSNKLKKAKKVLELTVLERTKEIVDKNNQLKKQAQKLEEMDKIKSSFFSNISHEFRTPLTLIIGPLEQALQNGIEKNTMVSYEIMLRNANRLLELIDQLLDLSKLESGHMNLEASKHSLKEYFCYIDQSFSMLASARNISYSNDIILKEDALWFDRDKMDKIIYNLLSNAIKFTQENGKVNLHVRDNEEEVIITVSDTGQGIPKEKLSFIFDRFYQADASYVRKHKGTGIGLALTKELVELHSGKIQVISEEGAGTEFILKFKKGNEHLKSYEIVEMPDEYLLKINKPVFPSSTYYDQNEETLTTVDNDEIVLIAEDNDDVRSYIVELLKGKYKTLEASNGNQALEIAKDSVPDLIITDIMMPEMDGNELTKKLKKEINTCHIPIIMLTAKTTGDYKLKGLNTGADDYLIKPFNPQELLLRIRNLVMGRKRLRDAYSKNILSPTEQIEIAVIDKKFLDKCDTVIYANLQKEDFDVEELSSAIKMSRSSLFRKLKAITTLTPSQYINTIRLKTAATLLTEKKHNISEIAYMTGFNSSAYFTRRFKELYGCTPSEYTE